ncbi:pilus assembly protein [Ralstonia sp. A12]|uniref:pilus assembly PilX N-terminal domain-containing protein n=1 Tax=Ralstonia sp. A12 TaxID=1217052 RepID=UPI000573D71D|nr:pilus assembly PilX N-terminal domain-containing protein [Ralstonia sp. A12]KHK50651.1 pilus assembly protein [Ralstonia sp. A12]
MRRLLVRPPVRRPARQSGVTLVVTLIFLAIFMAVVVMIMNSSVINTKIAANQQYSVEARGAAQQGIEQVISQDFTSNPVATSVPVDVNGDGKTDYTAQVAAPVCMATKQIADTQLTTDPANPNYTSDSSCFGGVNNNSDTGILTANGTPGGMSNCSATQWDVSANVNDANATNTNTTLHQGVAVRVLTGTACP